MANEQNLNPIRSTEEAREIGRKGGIASGIARREKRKMREIFTTLLAFPSAEGENLKEKIALALIQRAIDGDIKAITTIMNITGEMPTGRELHKTDEEIMQNPFDW